MGSGEPSIGESAYDGFFNTFQVNRRDGLHLEVTSMSLVKKLFIKRGYRVIVVNAPEHFALPQSELPEEVEVCHELTGDFDFVLLFAHSQDELSAFVPKVLPHMKDGTTFWVAYPKKSSKIKSDISRDHGWDVLHAAGYQGVSLISIDETWSAMRFRKTESE
jgi:hypothetical protein